MDSIVRRDQAQGAEVLRWVGNIPWSHIVVRFGRLCSSRGRLWSAVELCVDSWCILRKDCEAAVPGSISNQLASLVPSFDPSKDDLQLYQQKVQLVFSVWPSSKISELITRLILNTTGTAFSKLQLHHTELCVNDEKGVKRLVELLGGHWGQTGLERRYSDAEKALYQCVQQSDESHDSYLARADVLWTRLMTQKLKLEDLQAYVTLRGAILSSEDKKRVILDSDNSLEGKLTIVKVQESIRMLGTSFFQEMTGVNKKTIKAKVYDQSALLTEDADHSGEVDDSAHVTGHEDVAEEEFFEHLAHEGDEDAVFVADFEAVATDLVQSDEDLSAALSTYIDARRKLSEKYRARGFWPVSMSSGKGKSKGSKGKAKGRFSGYNRKSLQQRILESNCRICGRKGHWKSECPNRGQSAQGSNSQAAPVTLSMSVDPATASDAISAEFLNLPEVHDILSLKALPVVSQRSHRPITMSDWVQRLQRLQANKPAKELENIDHMTLDMLKSETVKFGKAHQGKTYEAVWESSPEWIKWFFQHYEASENIEHRKVIRFTKLMIQDAEGQGSVNPQLPMMPKSKAGPKSLACKSRPATQPEMINSAAQMSAATGPWVETENQSMQMAQMQDRMANLENALHQILVHLTPPSTATTMEQELPVIPVADEWDEDPWNPSTPGGTLC
eukprot:s125_g15.t1